MTKHRHHSNEKHKKKKADEVNCGMMTVYSVISMLMILLFVYIVFLSGEDIDLEDEFEHFKLKLIFILNFINTFIQIIQIT